MQYIINTNDNANIILFNLSSMFNVEIILLKINIKQ